MSHTTRKFNPYYTTKGARTWMPARRLVKVTSTRDGSAPCYLDAGGGSMVAGITGKRFAKRRMTKRERKELQVDVFNAVMEEFKQRKEEEEDLEELCERMADIEEEEARRFAYDSVDDDYPDEPDDMDDPDDYGDDPWTDPFDDY